MWLNKRAIFKTDFEPYIPPTCIYRYLNSIAVFANQNTTITVDYFKVGTGAVSDSQSSSPTGGVQLITFTVLGCVDEISVFVDGDYQSYNLNWDDGIDCCPDYDTIGISTQTFTDLSSACAYSEVDSVVYSANAPLTNGDVVYQDVGLSLPFFGGGFSYVTSFSGNIKAVTISNTGVITNSANC